MHDESVCIVSAVRDFDLYGRLIAHNPNTIAAQLITLDNRKDNLPIPRRYNDFLEDYDYSKPAWFVFCHEDFEILEPLAPLLEKLPRQHLYGPFGCKRIGLFGIGMQITRGHLQECNRDGSGTPWICGSDKGMTMSKVETFDCCCLIVHSSLVQKHHLRFDENLLFDLYVEDFCATAKIQHGIQSRILRFSAMHHSGSHPTERLYRHLPYLEKKYPRNCFCGTCTYFGTMPKLMRLQRALTNILQFFRTVHPPKALPSPV